jgi:hypothetical protein
MPTTSSNEQASGASLLLAALLVKARNSSR